MSGSLTLISHSRGSASKRWFLVAALGLAIGAGFALACGSSEVATPAPAATSAPDIAPFPSTNPVADAVEDKEPVVVQVKIGNSVGDQIPEFQLSLTDGTAVNSSALHDSVRPVFLFFFSKY